MADILKYLPDIYKEFYEFRKTADAINPEFDLWRKRHNTVEENIYPNTADRNGIARFEELLNIIPLPTESLEERRARVIAQLNHRLPYTEIQLRRILAATFGWENFRVTTDNLEAKLMIRTDSPSVIQTSTQLFWDIIPMNMLVKIGQFFNSRGTTMYVGSVMNTGAQLNVLPKQDEAYDPTLELGSKVNFCLGTTLRITPQV